MILSDLDVIKRLVELFIERMNHIYYQQPYLYWKHKDLVFKNLIKERPDLENIFKMYYDAIKFKKNILHNTNKYLKEKEKQQWAFLKSWKWWLITILISIFLIIGSYYLGILF